MEKTSHSVPEPSVKGVMQRLLFDLNQLPVDISEEPNDDVAPPHPPNDDVAPPLPFVIDLCFHKEDMEVLKQKYKVLGSSSSFSDSDHFKALGFKGGCQTMIRTRDKRVRIHGNSFHGLGRSWLKEFTKKDENRSMVSLPEPGRASMAKVRMEGNKDKKKRNEDNTDHIVAKELLQKFVMQAKARASAIKKKGKKKVRFTLPPRDGIKKKKFVRKKRSLNSIMIIDQEDDA